MDWIPQPSDMEWLTDKINLLADEGTLVFPDAMLVFTVSKTKKTLFLLNPYILPLFSHSRVTYDRTVVVAEKIGYSVVIQ